MTRMPRPPPPQLAFSITGITDLGRLLLAGFEVGRQWRSGRHDRHTGRGREISRRHLVAEGAHDLGRGADEDHALAVARLDEIGVFREKAVARVNCIGFRFDGDAQDVLDVEVGIHGRLAASDEIGLVGLGTVQRKPVFLRINRDGADSQLAGGAHDANGDFAAIGNQQAADTSQHEWLLLI